MRHPVCLPSPSVDQKFYCFYIFQERHNYNDCITFYQQTFWIYKLSWIFKIFKKIFTTTWTSLRDHRSQHMRSQVSRSRIQDPRSKIFKLPHDFKDQAKYLKNFRSHDPRSKDLIGKPLHVQPKNYYVICICIMVILVVKFSFQGYKIKLIFTRETKGTYSSLIFS